jgi:Restriction endonuclease BglII
MFDSLTAKGFQVVFLSHAQAILSIDFPEASAELESALAQTTIPIEEIIAGGGGESKGTQRLRKALTALQWPKTTFTIEKRINGVPRESVSHEIDHVRSFGTEPTVARIALEIEWNNKDPFYDRDLENFKRLHADGAISVGVIVTRGKSLHENMRDLVRRFLDDRQIEKLSDLEQWGYSPTAKQRDAINKRVTRKKQPLTFREAFTDKFVADKFGEATTHWRKLEDRVHRGVGNPCPLVLIGLPDSIVTFHEGKEALAEVEADEDAEEREGYGSTDGAI